jgi:hypothetical protein
MLLRLYLVAHNKEGRIVLNRERSMADVIFLAGGSVPGFDL